MPWLTLSPMSQRVEFVSALVSERVSMRASQTSSVCAFAYTSRSRRRIGRAEMTRMRDPRNAKTTMHVIGRQHERCIDGEQLRQLGEPVVWL